MFCIKCGEKVKDESIFCPNCGTRLYKGEEKSKPVNTKPDSIQNKKKVYPEQLNKPVINRIDVYSKRNKKKKPKSQKGLIIGLASLSLILVIGIIAVLLVMSGIKKDIVSAGNISNVLSGDIVLSSDSQSSGIALGDTVTFGNYEQDNDLNNGQEKIEWIVLEENDGKVLLLSKSGLDTMPLHDKSENVTWENVH